MKLGLIDYQLPRGGVERFILNVLNSLPEDTEITLYSAWDALAGYRDLLANVPCRVTLVDRPVLVQQSALLTGEQALLTGPRVFEMPAELWQGLDVVWMPWANRHLIPKDCYVRTVATVHDVIAVELADYMASKRNPASQGGPLYAVSMEDMLMRRLVRSLAKVTAISARTRDHLAETYGPLTRLPEVIYHSTEHIVAVAAEPVDALGLPPRYLVYPASTSSHKNHETLLVALAKVKEAAPGSFLPLVLTGGGTRDILGGNDYRGAYLRALIDHLGLEIGRDLFIPGHVSDGQLRTLMEAATGMVFPTLAEGYGFPPIEAAYLGVPVAASDIAVLHETMDRIGAPALWFPPQQPDAVAAAMIRLCDDEAALRARCAEAKGRLAGEGWDEVGRQYLQVFRDQIMVASMYQSYGR